MMLLDASALVKLVLDEDGHDRAKKIFESELASRERVLTVNLALPESLNAIWKYRALRKELTENEFSSAVDDLLTIFGRLEKFSDAAIAKYAASIAVKNKIAVYDAFYLAASILTNVPLFTFDGTLKKKAELAGAKIVTRQ